MNPTLLAFVGFFCFTLMDLSIKWLLQFYPLPQVVFLNGFFALLFICALNARQFSFLKTRRPGLHFVRAILLLIVDALAFYSYGQVPLAEAYTLILTLPLFTTLGGFLVGLEAVNLARLGLAVVGFCGAIIVLSPGFETFRPALFCALVSAMVEAISFLVVVKHRESEHHFTFAFYGLSTIAVVALFVPGWSLDTMTSQSWGVSASGGAFYALATYCVLKAFRQGRPSTVSSMQYSQLLWGLMLAAVIWGEYPGRWAVFGGAIITLCGLILVRHDFKKSSKMQMKKRENP